MIDYYDYFFEIPLYQKIELEGDDNKVKLVFEEFIHFTGKLNAYNPILKENTTYNISTTPKKKGLWSANSYTGFYIHTIECVRTKEQFQAYSHFNGETNILQKIGQFLSIADFHISQIKKYDSVLEKEKLKEFTRAIGLAANGVGIGSFIYLRRVFEKLLEEAHSKAKTLEDWKEGDYKNLRVNDKIEKLKSFLPTFLVENKELYGILSTGVHSLKENECLAYYETVKAGIEIILDEKLEEFEKKQKIEKARAKIAALNSKLKK